MFYKCIDLDGDICVINVKFEGKNCKKLDFLILEILLLIKYVI